MKLQNSFRDYTAESALFVRRALVAFLGILLLTGVLIANLYNLQIVRFTDYQTRSNENRIKLVPIAPSRGSCSCHAEPLCMRHRLCQAACTIRGRGMQLWVSICAEAAAATASAIAQQAQRQQQWEQQLLTCFASSSTSPQLQAAHLPGPAHRGSRAAPAHRSRCGPAARVEETGT